MPRAYQHGPFRQLALKNFFETSSNFKGFHEVNRITGRARTAHGTSEIITFGERDPEPTMIDICSDYMITVYHYMFNIYSLYIHYIFTICSLYIHYIFITYSLYIHYISTICSLNIHYIFTTYSLHIHHIFTINSLYVHYMFTIYSLYVHYIFTVCSPSVHYISLGQRITFGEKNPETTLYNCCSLLLI